MRGVQADGEDRNRCDSRSSPGARPGDQTLFPSDNRSAGLSGLPIDLRCSVLETVVEHVDAAVACLDAETRVLTANASYRRLCGPLSADVTGCRHTDLLPGICTWRDVDEALRGNLAVAGSETAATDPSSPASETRYFDWRLVPCAVQDSVPGELVLTLVDVTGRVRQSRRERALTAIGATMTETLAPRALLARMAEQVRWALDADHAAFALIAGETLTIHGPDAEPVSRITTKAAAPWIWKWIGGGDPVSFTCPEPPAEAVFESGCASDDGNGLALPVSVGGRPYALVLVAAAERSRRYSQAEVEFAGKAVDLIGGIIDRARLQEAHRRIAQTLQENLIHPLPNVAGVQIAAVSQPAHQSELVGGDFHDVFELPDGRLVLLIGDVQGKGIRAAGLTETVRSAVRALAIVAPSPHYVLATVNQLLLHEDRDQFVTAALLILDPATGHVRAGSAGHPVPVHVASGVPRLVPMSSGPPLGSFTGDYSTSRFQLDSGDSLILYTDGLTEARDGRRFYGERRLLQRVAELGSKSAHDYANGLLESVMGFAGHLRDDLQVVVARLTRTIMQVADQELTLAAPLASWRLAEIRGAVRDFLHGHRLSPETSGEIVLCVEEACANVIMHSGSDTPGQLQVRVDEQGVDVVLKDQGRGFGMVLPDPCHLPHPMAGGGRGLFLIAELSDQVEFWNEGGACVHFRRNHRAGDR